MLKIARFTVMGTKSKCMLCFFLLATTTQVYIAESNNNFTNSVDVIGFINHSDTNWTYHSTQNVFSDTNTIDETTQNKPSDFNDKGMIKQLIQHKERSFMIPR